MADHKRGDGVAWPLTIYRCEQCSRPTLFEADRCCSGFVEEIKVAPIEQLTTVAKTEREPVAELVEAVKDVMGLLNYYIGPAARTAISPESAKQYKRIESALAAFAEVKSS